MYKTNIKSLATQYGIIIVFIVLFIFFSLASNVFLTPDNIFNILRQVSIVGITAVGMTFVMLTGGIDLSVGSIIGVASVSAAELMIMKVDPVLATIITLLICTVIGFINGILITKCQIPPLIATLGTMTSLRGIAFIITGGMPVFGFQSFGFLGQGYLWIIPIPVIIMVIIFGLGYIFLTKMKYGRYIYGTGGNEEASRLSGINIKRIKYMVYSICGFLSGLAGIILLSRIDSGQPKAGQGYEMDVITAVVLGGVSITGGEGKIFYVIVGVIIMGILSNGMILLNINEYVQWVVKGLVLLAAVAFDRLNQNRANVSVEG